MNEQDEGSLYSEMALLGPKRHKKWASALPLPTLQFALYTFPDHVQAVLIILTNGVQPFNGFRRQRKGEAFRVELLASHAPKINRMYGIDKGFYRTYDINIRNGRQP